ncbi:MAG: SDR family NAD(P)-dependent oxidoreductase, partial [Dehalococcoidia bacterium]
MKDRVALVTGAGRGIGRQICLTLGQEGAKVAVNDVFQERAEAVAEEIRQAGGQALGVVADVTDLEAVSAMVSRIADEWG